MPKGAQLNILGSSGLKQSGGRIDEEWHPKLSGQQAAKIYREMSDNDPVIGAFVYMIESLVRQVDWTVNAGGDTPEHEEAAEFLRGCMDDMSHTWVDFISEVLTMVPYGWAYFEVVYKLRQGPGKDPTKRSRFSDGAFGWRKFHIIGQTTLDHWEIDEDGGIRGLSQTRTSDYRSVFIPIEKSILFRTRAIKNNPEGRSMLRNAYRSWFFLKRIQEIEAIGIERDLAGYPVLEVPPNLMAVNASSEDQALRSELELLIQQIRRDEREGALIPAERVNGKETGYKLRLLSSGGRRPVDVDAIVKRYESRIGMSVLAEFLLLGTDKVGSFALADTKTDIFAVALGALLDTIVSVLNRFAVPKIMGLNGIKQDFWPEIGHGDIERPDLAEFGGYLKTLSEIGYDVLDEDTERVAREYGGLPSTGTADEVADDTLMDEEVANDTEEEMQPGGTK